MDRSPSRDASHDGPSAEAKLARGAKNRVRGVLRLWHLVVLAIATLVCAGIASPARGIANLPAPDSASAVRWSSAPPPSRQCRDAARPVVDFEAIESIGEDEDEHDDDTLSDIADDQALASRGAPFPRKNGRTLRDAAQTDPLRFAIGTGLPRGPPA